MPRASRPSNDFTDSELQIVNAVVSAVIGSQPDIGGHTFEDLFQIGLTHWWEKRGGFDLGGPASGATYMRKVVRNKLLEVVAGTLAEKRGRGVRPVSMDAPLSDEDEETLHDVLPNLSPAADVEAAAMASERRFIIERFRSYQAPEDRRLIDALLQYGDVRKASRAVNTPPSTAYGRLARMRPKAESEGLRDFL